MGANQIITPEFTFTDGKMFITVKPYIYFPVIMQLNVVFTTLYFES